MVELKIGRRIYNITEKDVALFNGACWLLTSQTYFNGWKDTYPAMSKVTCEKFVKKGILEMFKKEKEYTTSTGKQMGLYYYKFNMEKLNEFIDTQKNKVKP